MIDLDQDIHTWPSPWTAEGKDLATVSRKAIPMTELIAFHQDTARRRRERRIALNQKLADGTVSWAPYADPWVMPTPGRSRWWGWFLGRLGRHIVTANGIA
jgi:hypothetical protein